MKRKHIVYEVNTGFKPKIERNISTGRLNWGAVLDSQSKSIERNKIILDIVKEFKDRNFLILTKRIHQGKYLLKELINNGEDATSLLGNNQEFNKESRILIGTTQKVGVGFDHAKLDALILASDVKEYFQQYLGRVFRVKHTIPIVFDLVDDNNTLKKHYIYRKKIYKKFGGKIKIKNKV